MGAVLRIIGKLGFWVGGLFGYAAGGGVSGGAHIVKWSVIGAVLYISAKQMEWI